MATAVEEKVVDLEHDHFYDSGKVTVDGATMRCWKAGGHGDQTFLQVLQNSCNLVAEQEIPNTLKKSPKIKEKLMI